MLKYARDFESIAIYSMDIAAVGPAVQLGPLAFNFHPIVL